MKSFIQNIGIQSWCFRHFTDLPTYLRKLKETGVSATEMCGIHADLGKPEGFPAVLKHFKDAGVTIHSIGVEHMSGDVKQMRPRFEFLKASGAKVMSVSFAPDGMWEAFRAAEKLADEYDVKLAIHNHGGYDWLGNATILDYVFRHTGPRIGLCLDTAWALDAMQNPVEMAERFKDRLYGIHIKDFVFDRARHSKDVIVGTGNLDLAKLLATLEKNKFNGSCILEYEADETDPVPSLRECLKALRAA